MALPTFLIIGAQKSGTTSLIHDLLLHPSIGGPTDEIHYFDRNFRRGLDWYRSKFPYSTPAIGETSPGYLFDPSVPERIAAALPDVRLIAILRNPIDRAYSQYWHNRTRGHDPLTFEDALRVEEERTSRSATAEEAARWAYAGRGLYFDQLSRYLEVFPRTSLAVLSTERYGSNRAVQLKELYAFLAVDSDFDPTPRRVQNPFVVYRSQRLRRPIRSLPAIPRRIVGRLNVRKTSYPPMSDHARQTLRSVFDEPNRKLGSMFEVPSEWN